MASRNKYRKKWLRWHGTYTKRANTELRRTFKKWTNAIPWDELTEDNYKSKISEAVDISLMSESFNVIYTEIGKVHGSRVGKDINAGLKEFTFSAFLTVFEQNVAKYLREFGVRRIVSIRKNFFEFIIDLMANRIEKEQDMRTVAREIQKEVNRPDFYRWQAERIARTESTAAANYAALQASDVSGFIMVKEWISATDSRTRRHPENQFDHLEMDGVQIPRTDKFVFNGGADLLDYPGDPSGQAGNVINCRCAIAIVPKRDSNGDLIPSE